jgi:phosphopantetheinyl transferase
VLKASGVGIMDDLRSLRVDATENLVTITHDAMRSMAAPAYFVHSFSIGADHMISVASPEVMEEVVVWGAEET